MKLLNLSAGVTAGLLLLVLFFFLAVDGPACEDAGLLFPLLVVTI